jgi:HAD superfamily 5'-nucleotidase-like hydrolase
MTSSALPSPKSPREGPEVRLVPGKPKSVIDIARAARVFVNRNLRMSSIGAVGFDLDYTLAHYRIWEIDNLAFRLTKKKLVEKRRYPEEILEIPFDPEFVVRGLVIDRRRGNILKMDRHNYVARAFHGRRPLSPEERKSVYRMRRIKTSNKAYVSVDTLFHLPEVYLYLALIDFHEERGLAPNYPSLYHDVREMIDEAHADSSIKGVIQEDPGRFLSPDPKLPEFLTALRKEGKKVFLLTNSELFYTESLLSYLLDPSGRASWCSYFDLIVVEANKPRFFLKSARRSLKELTGEGEGAPIFAGGDAWKFERLLGFAGDSILYWGDHTYGDILRSKKSVGWRTAMIVPELEQELLITERIAADLARLEEAIETRDRIDAEEQMIRLTVQRLQGLLDGRSDGEPDRGSIRRRIAELRERLKAIQREKADANQLVAGLDEACSLAYNRHWGMLFREGNQITRFAHQVKDFACIYTSRVSNFLNYPPNTYFRTKAERMPHEL